MVDGTKVAIESDEDTKPGSGRFANERHPVMGTSSEKTSELVPQYKGRSGRNGVKGPDERQQTAPLTPSRPQGEIPVSGS